nr:Myc-type, basic helix-loop-helix (bHLH) domain-containing protein [Tanacetum cinerariifolium]
MIQHEPYFILEVVDNGFGSLAMWACVYLRSRRVFNLKGLIKRDKEKVKALGANGEVSGSRVVVVWIEDGGGIMKARISMKLVHGIFFGGFLIEEFALEAMVSWKTRPFSLMLDSKDSLLGKKDHHVIYKIEFIPVGIWVFGTNIFKESSDKHSVGKSHVGTFGHTYHSVEDVAGKITNYAKTFVELKHKDGANLFDYIEKTLKTNPRESRAKVRLIIKICRVDNAIFMDQTSFERLVDLPFMSSETSSSVIHENVVSGGGECTGVGVGEMVALGGKGSWGQSDELVFHQIPSLISFQPPATNRQDLIVENKHHVTMEGNTNKSVSKTRKRQEDQSPSSSKPNSATPEDSTKDEHTQRKLVHREIERQRRQDMAKLYASLRGLLPLEFIKGKRSTSDLYVVRHLIYKHMQGNIKEMAVKRDQLKKFVETNVSGPGTNSNEKNLTNLLPNTVSLHSSNGGIQISINSCPLEEGFPLSRILKAISKEGFKVITCTCTKVNDRLIHSIQAEENDPILTDLSTLQQRLTVENDPILTNLSMLQQRLTVVANKY